MGQKTAGVGHFTIPTAPAAGTSCTSGAANVFTGTYVVLSASAPAAIFITGLHVEKAAASAATYCVIQLATGGAGSEAVVGQYLVPLSTGSTVALGYRPIYPPIAVANATRIAVKTADSVGTQAALITLECINQANVVDDGIAVATVTTVTNQLTAAAIATGVWQDATAGDFTAASSIGKSLYTTGAVPGAAGGHFIAGSNAATTVNFTGNLSGSVGSVTGAVGSVTGAVGSVTGAVGSVTGNVGGNVTGSVGSVTGLTAANLDVAVSTRSTYAGGDTAGTTTLLSRLSAGRATNLDNLDAAVSTRSTYAGADTSGTTTLLSRLSAPRALLLDNLDAAVSSRFAAASYTAPDNASITAIKAKTDSLTFTVAGFIDSNCLKINGVTILGDGSATPMHA